MLVERLATENHGWGYQRIQGELLAAFRIWPGAMGTPGMYLFTVAGNSG